MTQQNALTTLDQTAGAFLQKFGKSLEQYAIRKYNKDTFLKSAMLALVSNPDLAECLNTEPGKLSLFSALRYAATTGLSLNPQEGKAALIPYNGRVQYQIMKNGMIDLSLESGQVRHVMAEHVRVNDKFSLTKTSDGDKYVFEPALEDRGAIRGFFATLKFKDETSFVKWMTKAEIEEIRDKYSKFVYYTYDDKNGKFKKGDKILDSPWNKSFIGMGEKTVIKKLLKSLSISEDLDNALASDDFYEADFTVEPGISADEAADKLAKKIEEKPEPPKQEEKKINKSGQGDLL